MPILWQSKSGTQGGGVNGKKIALDVEDTQTNQQQIVTAYHRLATKKPAVILGPTWLDGFQAIIPLAQKQEIALVTPSAAREAFTADNNKWPISLYHNSTLEFRTLVKDLSNRGFEKIALIYEQEPFAEMLRRLVIAAPLEPHPDIGVQTGTTGFQSLLSNLANKKPDVILLFLWDERSLLSLLQQLRVQLPTIPLATVHDGEGWLSNESFKKVLPRLIHTRFRFADESFVARFSKRFGYEPMLTVSNAYDAINSVLKAFAAGKQDGPAMHTYLTKEELETVTLGKFHFAEDGSVPSKVEVVERTF